jgi:hypothetical protein
MSVTGISSSGEFVPSLGNASGGAKAAEEKSESALVERQEQQHGGEAGEIGSSSVAQSSNAATGNIVNIHA